MRHFQNMAINNIYSHGWQIIALAAFTLGLLVSYSLAGDHDHGDDSPLATAQTVIKGEWTAELRPAKGDKGERVQFGLYRRTENGNHNMSSSDYTVADFQGLSREQMLAGASGSARFSLVREAGNIECEGTFRDGRGSGFFTLRPNPSFLSAMQNRGYQLTENKFFTAVALDLTTKFIADLESSGFQKLSFGDVIKARIFKITPDYIREMRGLGFAQNDLEELVKGRIFKITAEFAREVQEMGFGKQNMETLVKMRIFKVTPEFIKEIKDAGVENLDIEDLVKFRIHKVTGEFIRQAKANGYSNPTAEELVRLRIRGYVKETY